MLVKKGVISILIIFILQHPIFTIVDASSIQPRDTITIPDENLRKYIMRALDVNSLSDITKSKMEGLRVLKGDFSDLEGLQHASNLTYLDLNSNNISDITLLKDLRNLTYLDLANTKISDITLLKDLRNLTYLNLTSNNISDITPLKDLRNLTKLWLSGNKISDITPLKDLTNLTYLNLESTNISDISLLKDLTNLTQLNLESTNISDISLLKDLTNLTELNLNSTNISDISPLNNLRNLTYLNLTSNKISDISPLNNLRNLTYLDLESTNISDISLLKDLTNLTELNLNSNNISDITPLKDLRNLTKLQLSGNKISDITPIKDWEKSDFTFDHNYIPNKKNQYRLSTNHKKIEIEHGKEKEVNIIREFTSDGINYGDKEDVMTENVNIRIEDTTILQVDTSENLVKLTGKKEGSTNLIVSLKDNLNVATKLPVTIKDPIKLDASISLDKPTIHIGDYFTVTNKVKNNGTGTVTNLKLTIEVPTEDTVLLDSNSVELLRENGAKEKASISAISKNVISIDNIADISADEEITLSYRLQALEMIDSPTAINLNGTYTSSASPNNKKSIDDSIGLKINNGVLTFKDVPSTLSFGKVKIPANKQTIKRELSDWKMVVSDTRTTKSQNQAVEKRSNWYINASISNLLRSGSSILSNALVYKKGRNITPLNTQAITVFEHNVNGESTAMETDISWSEDEGVLLEVLPGQALKDRVYKTTINWELISAP